MQHLRLEKCRWVGPDLFGQSIPFLNKGKALSIGAQQPGLGRVEAGFGQGLELRECVFSQMERVTLSRLCRNMIVWAAHQNDRFGRGEQPDRS